MDTHPVTARTGRWSPGTRSDVEVAVLDVSGTVVQVNEAWERFARENGGDPSRTGVGASFLAVCDADRGDPVAVLAASAVRAALAGQLPAPLAMVIPCHAPHDDRWFDLLVTPRFDEERRPDGATLELSRRRAPDASEDAAALAGVGRDVMGQEHLRISTELHETVVGPLFTLTMELYGLATQVGDAQARQRLMAVVRGVDDAIVALRRTVFGTSGPPAPDLALRDRLWETLDRIAAAAGLETTLTVQGDLDRGLSDQQAVDVVAAVREGVASAVRHTAGSVAVRVGADDDELVVEVTYDGSDETEAGSGATSRVVRLGALGPTVGP